MSDLEKRTHNSAGNGYGQFVPYTEAENNFGSGYKRGRTDTLNAVREAIDKLRSENPYEDWFEPYDEALTDTFEALIKMELDK